MSDHQCFTFFEVAADLHDGYMMVLRHVCGRPLPAGEQLELLQLADIPLPSRPK